jgi:hypothetical protein
VLDLFVWLLARVVVQARLSLRLVRLLELPVGLGLLGSLWKPWDFPLSVASSEWSIGGCGIEFSFKLGQLGGLVLPEVESKPAPLKGKGCGTRQRADSSVAKAAGWRRDVGAEAPTP